MNQRTIHVIQNSLLIRDIQYQHESGIVRPFFKCKIVIYVIEHVGGIALCVWVIFLVPIHRPTINCTVQ